MFEHIEGEKAEYCGHMDDICSFRVVMAGNFPEDTSKYEKIIAI